MEKRNKDHSKAEVFKPVLINAADQPPLPIYQACVAFICPNINCWANVCDQYAWVCPPPWHSAS